MKQFLLIALFCISFYANSQIVFTPDPADINSGLITFTYGSNGDYSIFDPMSDPNLLLYTGLQTDSDITTWDYHDDFADTGTFTPLTFDPVSNAYVAQVDVAGRMYQEEPSLNMTTIPSGTVVFDWYFLIITTDRSRQSADLKGTDYGWQQATLSTNGFEKATFKVKAVGDQLIFDIADYYEIKTFDLNGRLVQDINRRYIDNSLDLSLLNKNQLYFSKITSVNGTVVVKHMY